MQLASCIKHWGEANENKFDEDLVRRKIHKSGMWEKVMESPNEVQHFPCLQSQDSVVLGVVGGALVGRDAAVDKLVQKSFGSSLKLVNKRQAALQLYYVGEKDKCLKIHLELKITLKISFSVKPFKEKKEKESK